MIAIVDYGLGNLANVKNAFDKIGVSSMITSDKDAIQRAPGVVFPGVGAAQAGMERLRQSGLDKTIIDVARANKPVLGICLGMQLLLDTSEEGDTKCLGIIQGSVKKFQTTLKIPQIGWNNVAASSSKLFSGITTGSYFYFVHSYYCVPKKADVVFGTSDYDIRFCSALNDKNIYGVQFHPEKSGEAGLKLLHNFAKST